MRDLISIITATKNSAFHIKSLIYDLNQQDDLDFVWVVVDGGSHDNTIDIINKESNIRVVKIQEHDSGIYDALNKGIKLCRSRYYMVCGSDDRLSTNAISSIKKRIIQGHYPDLVLSAMYLGARPVKAFWGSKAVWLGADRIVAGHSVGMAIRIALHERHGYYRIDLSQAADAEFIYKLYRNEVSYELNDKFVGKFNISGISNKNRLKQICETLQVQVEANCSPVLSFLVFSLRFFKYLLQKR
jgi:glycosyltransferase involved in cell wall biosynthesis